MDNEFNRLTIVVVDKAVYIDKVGYSDLDFSACGIPEDVWALQWQDGSGWIEFTDTRDNQPITEIPTWARSCIDKFWEFDAILKAPPPPPTPEQAMEFNKRNAQAYLYRSDWVMLSDVKNKVANTQEFEAYREYLRGIFFNPPDVIIQDDEWMPMPEVQWL